MLIKNPNFANIDKRIEAEEFVLTIADVVIKVSIDLNIWIAA